MNYKLLRESVEHSTLTKIKIAKHIKVSRNTLDCILQGETDARVSHIEGIAGLLGVSPAIFFDGYEAAATPDGDKRSSDKGRHNDKMHVRIKKLETDLALITSLAEERKQIIDSILPVIQSLSAK